MKKLCVKIDGVVKSLLSRHPRAGGNPEGIEKTRSKSVLISRLRGNDKRRLNSGFYQACENIRFTRRGITFK